MANRRMTKKYWDSLSCGSRYRALKKVLSNISDSLTESYSVEKANDLGFVWEIVLSKVRQTNDDHYKTCVDNTYIP